ncbi:MAG: hypothetical protein ACPG4T_08205 [Nannocystaceae bacterium]
MPYAFYEGVKTLLKYNDMVEIAEEPDKDELNEWILQLKDGADQQCIDLYHAKLDQYRAQTDSLAMPFAAVQSFDRGDDYEGAPPVTHLIRCFDQARLSEDSRNFIFEEDVAKVDHAIKIWSSEWLRFAVSRDEGWDVNAVPPEPEPPKPKPPEPPEPPEPKPPEPKPPEPPEPKPPPKPPKPPPPVTSSGPTHTRTATNLMYVALGGLGLGLVYRAWKSRNPDEKK